MTIKSDRNVVDYMAYGVLLLTAVLGVATLMTSTGCGNLVDDQTALRAVKDEGYTKATITEKHTVAPGFYGCDEKDTAGFEVDATNIKGDPVKLTVCCGIIKACTIRH